MHLSTPIVRQPLGQMDATFSRYRKKGKKTILPRPISDQPKPNQHLSANATSSKRGAEPGQLVVKAQNGKPDSEDTAKSDLRPATPSLTPPLEQGEDEHKSSGSELEIPDKHSINPDDSSTFILNERQLSTFVPTKENVIDQSTTQWTIALDDDDTITLVGQYQIWVRRGAVSIYGAILHQSTTVHRIHAPSTHSLPSVKAIRNPFGIAKQHTVITISNCNTGIRSLKHVSSRFGRIWNKNTVNLDGATFSVNPIGRTFGFLSVASDDAQQRLLSPLQAPQDYQVLISTLAYLPQIDRPKVVLVCGPKGSGKSTFCRVVANAILYKLSMDPTSDHVSRASGFIALLDIDPGQPEFSPPGEISLLRISRYNFGPPFTHPTASTEGVVLVRSHYVGATTPSNDPTHYIQCVLDLFRHYKLLLSQNSTCQLLVNTTGWIQGSGLELLLEFLYHMSPSDVVYTSDRGPSEVVEAMTQAANRTKTPLHFLASGSSDMNLGSAAEMRTLQTLSYFHLDESENHELRWNAKPITEVAPICFRYAGSGQSIYGVLLPGQELDPDFIAEVLEGCIVGLVVIEDDIALHGIGTLEYNTTTRHAVHNIGDPIDDHSLPELSEESIPISENQDINTTSFLNQNDGPSYQDQKEYSFSPIQNHNHIPALPRTTSQIPYIPPANGITPPLAPIHTNCIGQALIQSIDLETHTMDLITPIPIPILDDLHSQGRKIVLVRGNQDPPTWAYKEDLYMQMHRRKQIIREKVCGGALDDWQKEDTKRWAKGKCWVRVEGRGRGEKVKRASYIQDVCIFCTTRIQFASARPISRTQRRFLRPGHTILKPPPAGAPAPPESRYAPVYEETPPRPTSFGGGGWGKPSFSVELTPEEESLKRNIQHPHNSQLQTPQIETNSDVRPLNERPNLPRQLRSDSYTRSNWSTPLPLSRNNNRSLSLQWDCDKCATSNDRSQKHCSKCNRLREQPDAVQWRCPSCGYHNPRRLIRCTKCNSFNASDVQLGEIANQGDHVGRYPRDQGLETRKSPRQESRTDSMQAASRISQGLRRSEQIEDYPRRATGVRMRSSQEAQSQSPIIRNGRPFINKVVQQKLRTGEDDGIQPSLASSHQKNKVDQEAKVNRLPSSAQYARDTSKPSSPGLGSSPKSPRSFRSGWNTYTPTANTLSDEERNQRPAQSLTNDLTPTPAEASSSTINPSTAKPSADRAWAQFSPQNAFPPMTENQSESTPTSISDGSDRSSGRDIIDSQRVRRRTQADVRNAQSAIPDPQSGGRRLVSWSEASSNPPPSRPPDQSPPRQVHRRSQNGQADALNNFSSTTRNNQYGEPPQTSEPITRHTPGSTVSFSPPHEDQPEVIGAFEGTQDAQGTLHYTPGSSREPKVVKDSREHASKDGQLKPRHGSRADRGLRYAGPVGNIAAPYAYDRQGRRPRYAKKEYAGEEYEQDEDQGEVRQRRREQRKKQRAAQKSALPPTPIYLPEFISIGNLAKVLRVRVEDFCRKMQGLGFEETNNDHLLDAEVAGLVAAEFNFEAIVDDSKDNQDLQARPPAEDKSSLPPRPPIVTIMGHVDHGKTTLLDYLRKSSVAASEHGGITQHIGAFSVPMPGGRLVTFLDTPGHAAFLSMRQRGANVTDIVILVVAADDSVKPQTVEAINHAKAAKVPMIVAINKIDKEDKNIDRVKQDLARYGIEIEDFGGDTQVVHVSGKTGQGLTELEENVVALADILDMRAEADGQAEGWVLEGATKRAGRVATVLVRRGTVRPGDIIVAGSTWAKIKTLKNEAGAQVPHASPGTPVEVDGWKDQPTAGDEVLQATSEQQAKSAVEYRHAKIEKERMAADMAAVNETRRLEQEKREALAKAASASAKTTANDTSPTVRSPDSETAASNPAQAHSATQTTTAINVPILLKADVSGSVEACLNAITSIGNAAISPTVLRSSVGAISKSDIAFAASVGAQIVCFNQSTTPEMQRLAEREGVKLLEENVIYRLTDLVRARLEDLLPEKVETRVLGEAEVAKAFEIGVGGRKKMWVAGCRVRNGVVSAADKVRVLRGGEGGECVFDGKLSSLKNVKKAVTEMRKGTECGMSFEGWEEFKDGDMVQSYEEKKVKQIL
ncbi:MAG: hypothetical protein Q9219_002833 [cf. Caloplaca sp. 3 TL-2023]